MPSHLPSISIRAELKRDIFLATKEVLNNALKHAKANELNLSIKINEKEIEIFIQDNGVGFNQEHKYEGNGLINMQKRTLKNQGSIHIKSSENMGTEIALKFPLL
jgi:signal transduction histidine kinase